MRPNGIENQICKAIEILVDSAVKTAQYDKTIQGTVVSCVDEEQGKYKIRYQDSLIYAFTIDTNTVFPDGSSVYILVPGNDMSRVKTIIGSVEKLGNAFQSVTEEEDRHQKNGGNGIVKNNVFGLSSYADDLRIIYDKDKADNFVSVDNVSLKEYFEKSDTLICGATFKTELAEEQQHKGNYGIVYAIAFKSSVTGQRVTKLFMTDVAKMKGTPYSFIEPTRQINFFPVDGVNFIEVEKIMLFTKDFPVKKTDLKQDIFVSDLELFAARRLSEDEIKSHILSVYCPHGIIFKKDELSDAKRTAIAELKARGRKVDLESQDVEFYWFMQDIRVDMQNKLYHPYGGIGWACLNEYKELEGSVVEWKPSKHFKDIYKRDIKNIVQKFKCVSKYGNQLAEYEFEIKNLYPAYRIELQSTNGTDFYRGNGNTSVRLFFYRYNEITGGYDWIHSLEPEFKADWFFETDGEVTRIEEESAEATELKRDIRILKKKEKDGTPLTQDEKIQLDSLKLKLQAEHAKRPYKESELSASLWAESIKDVAKIHVVISTKGENAYVMQDAMTFTNSSKDDGNFRLIIQNNNGAFRYTESGVSPSVADKEFVIKPLKLKLIDPSGREVDSPFGLEDIEWKVDSNSFIDIQAEDFSSTVQRDQGGERGYHVIPRVREVPFRLKDKYSFSERECAVYAKASYRGQPLYVSTSLQAYKEGDPGTNGTGIYGQIINNSKETGREKIVPVVHYRADTGAVKKMNFTPRLEGDWFSLKIFKDGVQIGSSLKTNGEVTTGGESFNLKWRLLANKYGALVKDTSAIKILDPDAREVKFGIEEGANGDFLANIIQVEIQHRGLYSYAEQPVATVAYQPALMDSYDIVIAEGDLLTQVLYGADGASPQYKKRQTDIRVFKGGIDITAVKGEHEIEYEWFADGGLYDASKSAFSKGNYLSVTVDSKKAFSAMATPAPRFNGEAVNISYGCKIKEKTSGNLIAIVRIPVYMSLNRYGKAVLNGWNGNSIEIDNKGGVILAPQVGAGKKEDDNSFSGVILGSSQDRGGANETDVGLSAFHKGVRTAHIDGSSGYAMFGKAGGGQIVIDPTKDQGMIYSGNFWKEYYKRTEGENRKGMPVTDYTFDPLTKTYDGQFTQGMAIDLKNARILYGSGNFSVDENGFLTAKTGGAIANWKIRHHTLQANNGDTGMSAETDPRTGNGRSDMYVEYTGINDGSPQVKGTAFWAGDGVFKVAHDGHMEASKATIGDGGNKIFIGASVDNPSMSALFSGKKSALARDSEGFYLGVDGISLGRTHLVNIGNETVSVSNFQVGRDGTLYARKGYIGERLHGWLIKDRAITMGGRERFNEDHEGIYFGQDGLAIAEHFAVTKQGFLRASIGSIAGWEINGNKISKRTRMTPEERQRYGVTNPDAEKGIELRSDGSIQGIPGQWRRENGQNYWYINSAGQASLDLVSGWIDINNVYVTDGIVGGKQNMWTWIKNRFKDEQGWGFSSNLIKWESGYNSSSIKIPSNLINWSFGGPPSPSVSLSDIGCEEFEYTPLYYNADLEVRNMTIPGVGPTSWIKPGAIYSYGSKRFIVKR